MGIFKLRAQPVQPVRFLKRRQILPLNIFDQPDFERLRVICRFFNARHFAKSRSTRSVVPPLAGNNVEAVLGRDIAHQQRFQHALFANRLRKLAQVAEGFARLVRIRANLVHANHPPDRRAAVTR